MYNQLNRVQLIYREKHIIDWKQRKIHKHLTKNLFPLILFQFFHFILIFILFEIEQA